MAKLRLQLQSTSVLETYGIVDIYLNDQLLEEDLQLSGDVSTHEYDVTFADNNTLQVKLINSQAYDSDGSGHYDDNEADEILKVIVKKVERSADGVSYETILPIAGEEFTVEGQEGIFVLKTIVEEFNVFGSNQMIKFDSSGLKTYHESDNLEPYFLKGTLSGNIITYSDGEIIDTTE